MTTNRRLAAIMVADVAAHAYTAWGHEQRFFRGGFRPEDKSAALKHSAIVLGMGTDDPQSLSIAALVHAMITHDHETAIAALDRALEMNGNSALAFGFSAVVASFSERYDPSIEHAKKALRLSPLDPFNYHPYGALALTYFCTGSYGLAITYSTLTIQSNPKFSVPYAYLVASQICDNRLEAARVSAQRLLEHAPDFTVSGFNQMGLLEGSAKQLFADALRTAGLPE